MIIFVCFRITTFRPTSSRYTARDVLWTTAAAYYTTTTAARRQCTGTSLWSGGRANLSYATGARSEAETRVEVSAWNRACRYHAERSWPATTDTINIDAKTRRNRSCFPHAENRLKRFSVGVAAACAFAPREFSARVRYTRVSYNKNVASVGAAGARRQYANYYYCCYRRESVFRINIIIIIIILTNRSHTPKSSLFPLGRVSRGKHASSFPQSSQRTVTVVAAFSKKKKKKCRQVVVSACDYCARVLIVVPSRTR